MTNEKRDCPVCGRELVETLMNTVTIDLCGGVMALRNIVELAGMTEKCDLGDAGADELKEIEPMTETPRVLEIKGDGV